MAPLPAPSAPPSALPSAAPSAGFALDDGSILNVPRGQLTTPDAQALLQKYTVKAGDTLERIAARFGLDVTTIYWANKSSLPNPQLVKIGQVLVIPPLDGLVVTVGPGDTVDSIATKYGVAAEDIDDANNLYDGTVAPGETILVPGADGGPMPAAKSSGSKLVWPVPSVKKISQVYGCTGFALEPSYGKCAHFHSGIDIAAPAGTPVVAAASGTVIYAGPKQPGSYGYGGIVVWISHGGNLYTTYNHLSATSVKPGQKVKAGQRIGSVGATGIGSGPHLDFEVWVTYPWADGTVSGTRNPLTYLR